MENFTSSSSHEEPIDHLSGLDDPAFQVVHATTGQRFLNYLVDNLFMNYGLGYITGMLIGAVLGATSPRFLEQVTAKENVLSYLFFGC